MGVRGLTTFIKNNEKKYLKPYKLHNCTVLLDGNSVASNLYIWSNLDSAFGGDYDKYAKFVKEYFKNLKKCQINPLVVFDGGYEQRKLKTVYSRLKDKYRSARDAQPLSRSITFPLFMRIVFREVLIELNIPFAQSDFEADDELAALARQLQCPVISNDSDFYIYDVEYIPLPSMGLIPVKLDDPIPDGSNGYYIECKKYSVDVFIESFGGLDKNMLPLLAALLGNDYIKRSVFKAFYENLRIPKGKTNPLQRRIKAVIDWLRNETFETATRKILGRMKKRSRRRVMGQLRKIVQGYVTTSSFLYDYMMNDVGDGSFMKRDNLSIVNAGIMNILKELQQNIDTIDDADPIEQLPNDPDESNECCDDIISSESEDELIENDDEKEEINDEINSFNGKNTNIPNWILDCARRGRIQSSVIDILSLKQYFCPPQVEDYSLTPSHYISLPILNFIVGILIGDAEHLFRYWTRSNSSLVWYTLEPSCKTLSLTFPPCDEILNISDLTRKKILLEIAGVNIELSCIPEEWHLFFIAASFWLNNMKEPSVSEAHFHTIIMCLVAIYTIDLKIGIHRNKQTFSRKYKSMLNKLIDFKNNVKKDVKDIKAADSCSNNEGSLHSHSCNPNNVSHQDCVIIFESILPYHHLNENIKAKPKQFCSSTIHAFAQFQSCMFHLMVLNSVLGFPFKEPCISKLYSGIFVYNMYSNLSKKNNIAACIESILHNAPSLYQLYNSLVCVLKNSLGDIELSSHSRKNHKKKRKTKQKLTLQKDTERLEQEEDELFYDENNIFSRLSINA